MAAGGRSMVAGVAGWRKMGEKVLSGVEKEREKWVWADRSLNSASNEPSFSEIG